MSDIIERLANAVPQIKRGRVWCVKCGATFHVNGSDSTRWGWPKCCGATMTIDSPAERSALSGDSREAHLKPLYPV